MKGEGEGGDGGGLPRNTRPAKDASKGELVAIGKCNRCVQSLFLLNCPLATKLG